MIGHGFLELTVIMIAGGAGLRAWDGPCCAPGFCGAGRAAPGSRQAVWLVLGCIPLLIIAGSIEVSSRHQPDTMGGQMGRGDHHRSQPASLCLAGR